MTISKAVPMREGEIAAIDYLNNSVAGTLSQANTYTDGQISTEVTNRNAAITERANEIKSEVSETYATQESLSSTNNAVSTAQSTADGAVSAVNNLQVGGTNLWRGSSVVSENSGADYQWGKAPSGYIPVEIGDKFALSLSVDGVAYTDSLKGYAYLYVYDSNKTRIGTTEVARSLPKPPNPIGQKYTIPTGVAYIQACISIGPNTSGSVFRGKLERGTLITDWSPAPEDLATAAQSTANNAQIPIGGCIALIENSAPTAYGTWTYLGSTTAGSTTIYIYNRTA